MRLPPPVEVGFIAKKINNPVHKKYHPADFNKIADIFYGIDHILIIAKILLRDEAKKPYLLYSIPAKLNLLAIYLFCLSRLIINPAMFKDIDCAEKETHMSDETTTPVTPVTPPVASVPTAPVVAPATEAAK